jgi:hypothetical protein
MWAGRPHNARTLGRASPDWAIEDTGDVTELGTGIAQNFSYRSAEQYLYAGLASQTAADRKTNLGLMFQSLGQVIHHIQDMAHTGRDVGELCWDGRIHSGELRLAG